MFFFGKRKIVITAILLFVLGICGWFWKHRNYIPFLSQPLSVTMAPFEYGFSRFSQTGVFTIRFLEGVLSNWKELEVLQRENAALKVEQNQYAEILAENIRLRDLLRLKEGYAQWTLTGASVIARDYGIWTQTMVIDRGYDSGIVKYMPVITPSGVVGHVSEVYENSSRVQLITDPRSTTGGIIRRPASRLASMVYGNGNIPGYVAFRGIPKEADILKGDQILTSGYGGVYPKGLLIGTIESVEDDSLGIGREAVVKPAVNLKYLEEVFVIMDVISKANIEDTATQLIDESASRQVSEKT